MLNFRGVTNAARGILHHSSTERLVPCVTGRVRSAISRSRSLRFCTRDRLYSTKVGLADEDTPDEPVRPEHAVISTFDLFSIGVGPSSSHTVGPMRAARIFMFDLQELGLLNKVNNIKIHLYGSLAATGKGHHTPQAILLGLEGSDPETIDTGTIPCRYATIVENKTLLLGGTHRIHYDMDRDMLWRWDQVLKTHPNGMRFSVFNDNGDLLATNEYFSVGGGFVVNEKTKVDENLYYKSVSKHDVESVRLNKSASKTETAEEVRVRAKVQPTQPPYLFGSGDSLLALTKKHNMTIAQLVYDNELSFHTHEEIHQKARILTRIWTVMDDCIRTGVLTTETVLPGRLQLRRRAPGLYRRLMRGFYPAMSSGGMTAIESPVTSQAALNSPDQEALTIGNARASTKDTDFTCAPQFSGRVPRRHSRAIRVTGSFDHPVLPMPPRKTIFPAMDWLSCYAISVNEVNASGGRIVTSPTNGAAGVIPAVLKYVVEFVSEDPEKSISTFLLTAAAVGMLFKRGSTISAAEGGCQAEVGGIACSMASAGFAACMGASPEIVLQAAEIGIEHNLGLTCDPIDGLVQVPCIERNSLGAVKAVTAAQLAVASDGVYSVTLDEAIEAMRLTAKDMSVKYKETSLSGLATTVKIPLTSPAWFVF
ncbi:serine dehydratase alpha chain-domain-containing protein [Hysterangium stoloniferum]|nr:serine dehydratase alpha chain-domain-containing protein [Hysterangium stoloniferum]